MPDRPKKPRVIVTRKLPASIELRLKELFDTQLNMTDTPLTRDQLSAALAEADVLVPTVTDRLDDALIQGAGERLKLIASFGTGVDHIDLAAAKAKGITITNTPGVLAEDTADMVMALILNVMRRVREGEKMLRRGGWAGWGPTVMLGHRLGGKRLGIIGLGRIGQAVATRARAFGMTIHYHQRRRHHEVIEKDLDATWWDSLDEMLAHMDVVSVNCPLTSATHHLLNRDRLSRMANHAVLINTARGGIVDEAALADLLAAGKLGGAGIDVFERQPQVESGLLETGNTMLTPHIGSATWEARQEMGERILMNIRAFVDGHRPPDWVIMELAS